MTELQKLILDALDQLGSMTEHELHTACGIGPRHRGGFRTSLNRLFEKGFAEAVGDFQIGVSSEGVHAIEAYNIAHPEHECALTSTELCTPPEGK